MSEATLAARFQGRLGAFDLDAGFEAPLDGVTALFGPSGSGKTTLLRCIAGLTRLAGDLRLGSVVWQSAGAFTPTHRRAIGYAFQHAELFPHLTVAGNLDYGAKRAAKRADAGPAPDRAAIIDLLGLEPLLDRKPRRLSGGERQRVSLARALLSRPRILLMDEPLAGLDQQAKAEILPYLDRLTEATAVPILYVSHDVGEVARLADRIVQVAQGRVVASGPVADMLDRLGLEAGVSPFEESALLTGTIAGYDPEMRMTRIAIPGGELAAPTIDLPEGHDVRVRVRARDVALATERPQAISIRNILPAKVVEIAIEEGAATADVALDLAGARIRSRVTLAAAAELNLQPGLPIYALIKSVTFDGR